MSRLFYTAIACLWVFGSPSPAGNDTEERFQQALKLRRQADTFKLHAREFHDQAVKQQTAGEKLRTEALKLQGALRHQTLGGSADDSYKRQLEGYLSHARQYEAHLAAYNLQARELSRSCMQADVYQNEYRSHTSDYQAHCDQFHHGPDYPHYCPPVIAAHDGANRLAVQFARDEQNVLAQASRLDAAESSLQQAEQSRMRAEFEILSRSASTADLQKLNQLKLEYEKLQSERESLAKITAAPAPSSKTKTIGAPAASTKTKTTGDFLFGVKSDPQK